MGSVRRRLERLEGRIPKPASGSEAREHMREHLDRVARLRRGELDAEEEAEVRAASAAVERRMAEVRGEVVADGPLRRY